MRFGKKQSAAYGLGAVGKDMVYALSATYVMYYYQDLLKLNPAFVGTILMIARIFDAINDPFMGILVTKTRTRFGRFRPWLLSGTVLNAVVLYALFAAPPMPEAQLMVYFTVIYILWGTTYTMMDIPYWSMIPAVTETPKQRETLSVIGRTCAGIGGAVIQVGTVLAVAALGGSSEQKGFALVALIVAIAFVVTEVVLCLVIREKPQASMQTSSIREMFSALFRNDQAMVTVLAILLINTALSLTSNLVIYFFKYDVGVALQQAMAMGDTLTEGASVWKGSYTLFTTVGGAAQILGMMVVYPLLHKKLSNTQLFKTALGMAMGGYALILLVSVLGLASNMLALCCCGLFVFAANGILSVLTTVFLSSSVDYGELKTGRREESVIFSMQTFVVKAATGVSVFITGIGLSLIGLAGNTDETGLIPVQAPDTILGLRLLMTVLPILGLIAAFIFFVRRFKLTDEEAAKNSDLLRDRRGSQD